METGTPKSQARLRVVVSDGVLLEVPRTYAQSASGHNTSHNTRPPDSRSRSIASDSAHERVPYATFLKWPGVVLQRLAKSSRSSIESDFQKSLNVMRDYHHTVTLKATPFGEFTKWCKLPDNGHVTKSSPSELLAATRRENLQRFVDTKLGGNKARLCRRLGYENPSYINDLLNTKGVKSFGEKVAMKIEAGIGLLPGQLSIKDSPLFMDSAKSGWLQHDGRIDVEGLNDEEVDEVMQFVAQIRQRHKPTERRAKQAAR